jgi:hypothetical protein
MESIDMSLNVSGVRDTARVLRISTDTVLRELRNNWMKGNCAPRDAVLHP